MFVFEQQDFHHAHVPYGLLISFGNASEQVAVSQILGQSLKRVNFDDENQGLDHAMTMPKRTGQIVPDVKYANMGVLRH